jgi:uncharacterized surface protein with fasciclin (FAS1) repeats
LQLPSLPLRAINRLKNQPTQKRQHSPDNLQFRTMNRVRTLCKLPSVHRITKTLVAALKAAEYVDALSNTGPFTVFAPTDAAFGKLPEGTVDDLIKPENKLKLQDILEYHVYVGVIRESMVNGTMNLNQVNGKNVSLSKVDDKLQVNGANILATIETSNGIVYVIDNVLLPQ